MANDNDATNDDGSDLWVTPEDLDQSSKTQDVIKVDFSPPVPRERTNHLTPEMRGRGGLKGAVTRRQRYGKAASISKETYEHCADVYMKGDRTATSISRTCGVAMGTANRLVHHGYPLKSWKSLKERAAAWDKIQEDEERKAANHQARSILDRKFQARTERITTLKLFKTGLSALTKKWNERAQLARFDLEDEMTEVKLGEGPPIMVDGNKHILAGARLATTLSQYAELEEKELGLSTADEEPKADGTPVIPPFSLSSLTPAELDYVIANGGALPPTAVEERIYGTPGKKG